VASESAKITILGNGGWGCAIASLMARKGHQVALWGHDAGHLAETKAAKENKRYLPGISLPETIQYETEISAAVGGSDLVLIAIPTRYLAKSLKGAKLLPPKPRMVISLTKGIDASSLHFPSEVIAETTGWLGGVAVLSGPTIAPEVAKDMPATITLAHQNNQSAGWAQRLLSTPTFRIYTTTDRLGVELAAAVKNVIAIAAGVCDGMSLGDNAKAALLARGIAELRRLGRMMGAQDETFMGLAGVGDLYTTCASPLGRNRTFGERIGRGMSSEDAMDSTGGRVVEGANTALAIHALAGRYGVEMPICEAVYQIVHEGLPPQGALRVLLSRDLRTEGD